jgi:1-acyl-sn-glycerol-3-phosphate acyltransferase
MMWLGNIPVDRSKTSGLVASSAHELRIASGRMYIVIPPEGTRKGTGTWKTGFYFTALSAGVPIALGYLDYENKKTGILSMFFPTGSLEADMSAIQKLYKPFKGKNPR